MTGEDASGQGPWLPGSYAARALECGTLGDMALDPELLEILVCPESKEPLLYFEQENFLFCPDSRLKYSIEDDIPVMLIEEAERLSEQEAQALVARAPARA